MRLSIALWTINNLLRFTGFRVYVEMLETPEGDDYETRIGILWWGSPFNDGSRKGR